LLLNARTGQIMATADVANADRTVCQATLACDYPIGNAVWRAWEPGSVMKPLLVAAALNEHRTSLQDRFVDDQVVKVKDRLFLDATTHQLETIRNQDVLNLSRNTGAVHIYHTLGTNQQAQNTWHQYLTQHYQLGQVIPGVGPNDRGAVRDARGGRNLEVQLTGSSFGIGLTATPLQVAAAYAALVNGGQYVQPHFGTAAASHRQILQPDTSRQMIASLQEVLHQNNAAAEHPGFIMGAKSGTGPATAEDGTYKLTLDNGAYVGFVGRQRPEYILLVKIAEPKTYEFASFAARDAWTDIINDLLSKQLLFH
jgi:cell division protein FtsI/penicillin-binding protein 2